MLRAGLLVCGCGGSGGSSGGPPPPPAGFTISLSSASVALDTSGAKITVTLNPENGFSSSASCQVGGLPGGVNATPGVFNLTAGTPQSVSLQLNNVAVSGNSNPDVSCSSGTILADAKFALTVKANPGLALTLTPSSVSMDPGTSANVMLAISGVGGVTGNVTGTVTSLPAGVTTPQASFTTIANGDQVLNLIAASTATTSGTAVVAVTNGTVSSSVNLPITITTAPDFVLSTGIYTALPTYQGSRTTLTVSATPHNGFSQPIAVSFAAVPAGVTFTPSSFQLQPGTPQTVKVDASFSAALGDSTITVTGTGGGVTHSTRFTLSIAAPILSIGAQPSPVTVPAGSTASMFVGVTGTTGGTQTISVKFDTPPAGVTISPSAFTTAGIGGSQVVYVQAASNASAGNLTATATYGPVSASMTVGLKIGTADNFPAVSLSTFQQLVRTDALTPYSGFPAPNYLIYHKGSNRFFSTDAYLNQLNVIDAGTHALTSTLIIPGAFGIDQSADGSVLYVGTEIGDIYVVDPVKLTIVKRYPTYAISPYGFPANAVYALADGKLLLERYFLVPGYSWVDGNGPLALWDPATNDITVFTNSPDGQMPEKPTCLAGFENAILTNNRTRIMLAAVLTSAGSSQLCSLDPETDTWNWSPQITGGSQSSLTSFAVSPDGTVLAGFDGYAIYNLDPATLTVKNSFKVPTTQTLFNYPVMFLSADNSKVFIEDGGGADIFDEYDLKTGTMTGWIPSTNLPFPGSYSPAVPYYQGMTAAGLAAGVIPGGGVGLLDTAAVRKPPVGSHFTATQLQTATGPAAGGTATSWLPNVFGVPPTPLGSVYFGANAATDLNNNGIDGLLEAVTPSGPPGPVDVRTLTTDGGAQFIPFGFSYGPSVLETTTNYATAEGGGPASLYGFGFGPALPVSNAGYVTPPSDLQVTVGGNSAAVNAFNADPYGSNYYTSAPVPTTSLIYTVPPGAAGSTVQVGVTTRAGSTTATTAMTYLPALKRFPISGSAELVDGVYDPKRDVYYFTDFASSNPAQVRVFSATQGAWLASIPIPAPQGAFGPQHLYGIAISPDGSKLAVTDPGAIAIYLIDPDHPAAVQSFPYASQMFDPTVEEPMGCAVTNNGTVYLATADFNGDGGSGYLLMLNPATGKVTEVGGSLPTQGVYASGFADGRVVLTADGTRAFTNDAGGLGYLDVASGLFTYISIDLSSIAFGDYEMVLGANQTSLFGAGLFLDSNLNAHGLQALDVAEIIDAQYLYGAAFSTDGSLLFEPGVQSIDVFNGHNGALIARISLPVPLSPNFRALVSNGRDSKLVAITGIGNGIAIIDLNSFPEPNPVSYLSAAAISARSQAIHLPGDAAIPAATASKSNLAGRPAPRRPESPVLRSLAAERQKSVPPAAQ